MARFRSRRLGWVVLALAALAAAAPGAFRLLLWRWEQNSVLRGRLLAERSGCLMCHRPYAGVEIPNPGSRWGTVPAFQSGMPMMYGSETRQAIEEYVRYGAPRAWLDDPDVRRRLAGQHLRMPAFEGTLAAAEIADVVAFVAALEGVEAAAGEAAVAGRAVARSHGCLSCHGPEGSGGLPNPGSLGGFVPGFLGRNFDDLVRDEAEFREWVLEGSLSRLAKNPLVRYFWRRQKIAMPAFRGDLSDEEVGQLWAWVQEVRAATPL